MKRGQLHWTLVGGVCCVVEVADIDTVATLRRAVLLGSG